MFKSSSIYKFMGGLVFDSYGEEENFDPHEHRVIAHPTSYMDTMTHMLKGSIGAGVLAMPYAVSRVGIIYATITFLGVGILAAYCIQLLIKVQYLLCKRHRRGYMSYQKSMQFSVKEGPPFMRWSSKCLYWFVEVTLIIWQLGICTIYYIFVAENIQQVLALEYNMKEPKRFVGICGLFNIGMIIIISLYLVVGILGYIKYGDKIAPSITLNLPTEQKKAQLAKLLFAFAIFLSFPLQNYVAYSIFWRRISKKYDIRSTGTKFLDFVMRVVLVIIPWVLAVAIPQLGPFISLFGAFCLSLLAFIFPAIMSISLCYPQDFGPGNSKLIRDIFILISGLVIMVSGVFASILEITEHFSA